MREHCCEKLKFDIEIDQIINYDISTRNYFINFKVEEGGYPFYYCFYCGKKLPKSLSKEWGKATEHLNLDDLFGKE